jgi:hypothetical protein
MPRVVVEACFFPQAGRLCSPHFCVKISRNQAAKIEKRNFQLKKLCGSCPPEKKQKKKKEA